MSLSSDIDDQLIKLDDLLLEIDKNKQSIEKCFKETSNLLGDLEANLELKVYEYYKYLFHSKKASYLKVIGKIEESEGQAKICGKYQASYYEKCISKQTTDPSIQPPPTNPSKLEQFFDETLEESQLATQFKQNFEKSLAELQKVIDDGIITKIREYYQIIQMIPENFEAYTLKSSTYASFQRLYDQYLVELYEQTEKNPNQRQETILENLKMIIIIFEVQHKFTRKKFIENLLDDVNMESKLFSDISITEERIKKRYRELSAVFHPDKTSHWLKGKHRSLGRRFFARITEIKEKLLKKVGLDSELSKIEGKAQTFWGLAMDYQNGLKKDWAKLKILDKNHMLLHTDEELAKLCVYYAQESYEEYRSCCHIADKKNDLQKQIEFRGLMALCLYRSNKFLEAQLSAIAAMSIILHHSNLVKSEQLTWIESIFNKVRGGKETTFNEQQQKTSENEESKNNEGILVRMESKSFALLGVGHKPIDQVMSFIEKKRYQSNLSENLEKITNDLLIRGDKSLVRYLSPESKIQHAICRGMSFGRTESVTNAGMMGTALLTAGVRSFMPWVGVMLGAATVGLGLWNGFKLWKAGGVILKEQEIRSVLNDMIGQAMKFYENGDYLSFLKTLSMEYDKNKRLVHLENPSDQLDCQMIIKELLANGFKPDGIAYLLNVIGEVLCSGQAKIPNRSTEDVKNIGMAALFGVSNKILEEAAKKLDDKVTESRKNSYLKFNSLFAKIQLKVSSYLPSEFFEEENYIPFKARYEEMNNIAKMNIAIIKILRQKDDEFTIVREILKDVKKSIEGKFQFVSSLNLRLGLLEDFIWILSGQTEDYYNKEAEEKKTVLQIEDFDEKYLRYWDEELTRFKGVGSENDMSNMLSKAAAFCVRKAQREKINKVLSSNSWENAQSFYQDSIALNQKHEESILGYARCLFHRHKYSEMVSFLKKKSFLEENSEFWLLLSKAFRKMCDYKQALNFLSESLQRDCKNREAKYEYDLNNKIMAASKDGILHNYNTKAFEPTLSDFHKEKPNSYRILSIDGGWGQGVSPALWLAEIEKATHQSISKLFDMISGISTGAIIGLGLSNPGNTNVGKPKYSALDIVNLYMDNAKKIFTKPTDNSLFNMINPFGNSEGPKYTDEGRLLLFQKYFGERKLNEMMNEIVVPARYEENLYAFTRYDALNDADKNDSVVEVLMATTATPPFFPPYKILGKGNFVDGGYQVNHPAKFCYNEAVERYKIPNDKIMVLSLGTGNYIPDKEISISGRNPFQQECKIDMEMINLIGEKYSRWQVWLEEPISFDDCSNNNMKNLLDIGYQFIEESYSSEDNSMNKMIELLVSEVRI